MRFIRYTALDSNQQCYCLYDQKIHFVLFSIFYAIANFEYLGCKIIRNSKPDPFPHNPTSKTVKWEDSRKRYFIVGRSDVIGKCCYNGKNQSGIGQTIIHSLDFILELYIVFIHTSGEPIRRLALLVNQSSLPLRFSLVFPYQLTRHESSLECFSLMSIYIFINCWHYLQKIIMRFNSCKNNNPLPNFFYIFLFLSNECQMDDSQENKFAAIKTRKINYKLIKDWQEKIDNSSSKIEKISKQVAYYKLLIRSNNTTIEIFVFLQSRVPTFTWVSFPGLFRTNYDIFPGYLRSNLSF
ncbi:hypothetical protein GQR58_011354 [Nymphon striatum]|nr:hypothetical protein GQR58_011354 [Nymphon striatum]